MERLRYDGLTAELGASLTNVATAVTFDAPLTSDGGIAVPTLGTLEYIPLSIIDSITGKVSEIVYLTAYTSGGTTGTITRGEEGTAGAAHSNGDRVVHAPNVLDFRREYDPTPRLGLNLTKQGIVVAKGAGGTWDADLVESPTVMYDPKSGKWAMVYVGYGTTTGAQRAGVGLAYSTDGVTWTKVGSAAILPHSGTPGAPDQNGCSGPVIFWDDDNDQYVLYYIGLTATGYEAGTKSICYATATALTGPWTRHGAVITTQPATWRANAVWHLCIVERDGTWYGFFNASDASDIESIGYATAPSLTGPWTVDDTHSPVLSGSGSGWDSLRAGDPSVRRIGDMWVMDYYGYNGSSAADGIAVCPDAEFPLGPWNRYSGNPVLSPGAAYDGLFAHKPFVIYKGGILFHYYTAVSASNVRQIALATEGPVGSLVPTTRAVNTDSTLTGGGDLSADRTLGVDITAEAERVRDTIGAALVAGADIAITVDDPGNTITIAATAGGRWEVVMTSGTSSPPIPVETPDGTDWVYAEV